MHPSFAWLSCMVNHLRFARSRSHQCEAMHLQHFIFLLRGHLHKESACQGVSTNRVRWNITNITVLSYLQYRASSVPFAILKLYPTPYITWKCNICDVNYIIIWPTLANILVQLNMYRKCMPMTQAQYEDVVVCFLHLPVCHLTFLFRCYS